jgi:DNA-binding response OmpR family regulator
MNPQTDLQKRTVGNLPGSAGTFQGTSSLSGQVPRILLVDDDDRYRIVLAQILSHKGYHVAAAADGLSGWEALRLERYDLLITDLDLPGVDGFALTERVQRAGLTLPVIMASGSPRLHEASDYRSVKLAAILHKPFSVSLMVATINDALASARAELLPGGVEVEVTARQPGHSDQGRSDELIAREREFVLLEALDPAEGDDINKSTQWA